MEKLTLALITTSKKLKPYFQAYVIEVLTNYPLRQVLRKPDASERLLKRTIELSQLDVQFRLMSSIKGQAVTDFIANFTKEPVMHMNFEVPLLSKPKQWVMCARIVQEKQLKDRNHDIKSRGTPP
ncbi:Ribonuclease H [Abeliophyllum distichum]|uniref:Ribonuclease H n=1 Tax=Abeliophyllum distichum TaxID=126358 RepID=A0ABD1SD25_9LAMI